MASVDRRAFLMGSLGLLVASRARAEGGFTLSNARILVGDGTEITGGVRVEGTTITAVGPEVTGGTDLRGAVLWPGLYPAGTSLGLFEVDQEGGTHDDQESSEAMTPQDRVIDAYNPMSMVIPVQRINGVLGALVTPASGTLISGQAAWMRTVGDTVADALVQAPAGICINLGRAGVGDVPQSPRSRMGVAAKLRDLFDANKPPPEPEGKKKKDAPPAEDPSKLTGQQKALRALLKREVKALVRADRASDILIALELIAAYQLDAVLMSCIEGHRVAEAIAAAQVPVMIAPTTSQPSSFNTLYASYENAAKLHAAGVTLAFGGAGPHNLRDLPLQAGIAVAYGLPQAEAVAMLSRAPSLWGLQLGRIAPGYEASFVQCDGDPLQPRTHVLGLWSRGATVPLVSRQTELYERFKVLK